MGKATPKVVATSEHFALLDLLRTACSADFWPPVVGKTDTFLF